MTNIQVKHVDAELHEAARRRAEAEGHTLSEYVLELIRKDLRRPSRREWLERARQLSPVVLDEDVAEAIRRDREERANSW